MQFGPKSPCSANWKSPIATARCMRRFQRKWSKMAVAGRGGSANGKLNIWSTLSDKQSAVSPIVIEGAVHFMTNLTAFLEIDSPPVPVREPFWSRGIHPRTALLKHWLRLTTTIVVTVRSNLESDLYYNTFSNLMITCVLTSTQLHSWCIWGVQTMMSRENVTRFMRWRKVVWWNCFLFALVTFLASVSLRCPFSKVQPVPIMLQLCSPQ